MAATVEHVEVAAGQKNRLLVLVSAPLVIEDDSGNLVPVPELDVQAEIEALRETVDIYGDRAGFDIEVAYANVEDLGLFLTSNAPPVIFHFIGHGFLKDGESYLVLEDATGFGRPLPASELRTILTANDFPPCMLAVLNACHSAGFAEVLIEAGARHVVAVNTEDRILDIASQCFARHFYPRILRRQRISKAFEQARRAVMVDDKLRTFRDASTLEPVNVKEAVKIQLLPDDAPQHLDILQLETGEGAVLLPRPTRGNLAGVSYDAFLGRQVAIHEVVSRCRDRKYNRRVFIKGMGGMGKSALALAVGRWFKERSAFKDGVWWVDLRNVSSPPDARARIAAAMGLNLDHVVTDESLAQFLQNKDILFLLDDIDALLEQSKPAELNNLVRCLFGCRKLAAVITSRHNPPVWGGPAYELEHLDRETSLRLFRQLSGPSEDWMTGESPATSLNSVIRFLDGYPLPIRLAAYHLRCTKCGINELDRRLRSSPQTVMDSKKEYGNADTSLYATLQVSFDVMPQAAQELYPILSLLPSGLSERAATSIFCQRSITALERMLDYSMVEVSRDDGRRFSLPEPARDYASHKLINSAREESSRNILKWYCDSLSELNFLLMSDDNRETNYAASWIIKEMPNMRSLSDWGLNKERSNDKLCWSARCVALLTPYLRLFYPRQLLAAEKECVRAANRAETAGDALGVAHAVRAQGDIAAARSNFDKAIVMYRKAADTYRSSNELLHLAGALRAVAGVEDLRERYSDAVTAYSQAADALTQIGHEMDAGYLYKKSGDKALSELHLREEAQKHWSNALHCFEACAEKKQNELLSGQLNPAESGRNYTECKRAYDAAVNVAETMSDWDKKGSLLKAQGNFNRIAEDWQEAIKCYTESLTCFSRVAKQSEIAIVKVLIEQTKKILES